MKLVKTYHGSLLERANAGTILELRLNTDPHDFNCLNFHRMIKKDSSRLVLLNVQLMKRCVTRR